MGAEAEDIATRLVENDAQIRAIDQGDRDEAGLRQALAAFALVLGKLFPSEQARILALMLEKITVAMTTGEIARTLRPGPTGELNRRIP